MSIPHNFTPDWIEQAPAKGSYRSIFKYGDPNGFKHPNERLLSELKSHLNLSDEDFKTKCHTGNEVVDLQRETALDDKHIKALKDISGDDNVSIETFERLKYSTGQTVEEALKLRHKIVEKIADVVVHPRDKSEVKSIVAYCHKHRIPIYPYGGGSSVNFGLYPEKGGISLVLSTHMNKIVSLNEINQTATVQAGMLGPDFEAQLNDAPQKFGTKKRFTCGHFPQSFEYSSVGGWFVTLGSGQQSSYYGDAGDLVLGVEVVTPVGTIETHTYPATATGPKILDIIKGSEGIFGVVVELTWKIYRYQPENRQRFGFIFPTWESAVAAAREISQGEFGMPAVFRISDPEETQHGLKLYGIDGTFIDKIMLLRGYKPMQRCLFIGTSDGDKSFTKNIKSKVKRICRKHGAMYLTALPAKKWEPGRYKDPYIKEDLMDHGIIIDTLETGLSWDQLHEVHQKVRTFVKSRPHTICLTHASHFYPQGTNLYFIYVIKEDDIEAYVKFQAGIIDAIEKSGGSLSHHHGVGRMIGPWMSKHLGTVEMEVLRTLKQHFDPNNIMNPGSQLGLNPED